MIIETVIATGSNFELGIATKMLMDIETIIATGCNFELGTWNCSFTCVGASLETLSLASFGAS